MGRKSLIKSSHHFYHATIRADSSDSFYLPTDEIWDIFLRRLFLIQQEHRIEVSLFLVLPNRIHLLIRCPSDNISRIMYFLLKETTRTIQRRTKRINKIFGQRYKGCLITTEEEFQNVYKYIARRPIEKGLSSSIQSYPYICLNPEAIALWLPLKTQAMTVEKLAWLHLPFRACESESIKCGLTKTLFRYKKDKRNKPITPQ